MDMYRIGDKLVDKTRLYRKIDQILAARAAGRSQQEVADRLGVDRSFISRLETIGEVRKGRRTAVIGFPIANKDEVEQLCRAKGVEYILLMTDEERWAYVKDKGGHELLNEIMQLISEIGEFDTVVVIGSDMRIRMAESLLTGQVIGIELGSSPIEGDRVVDLDQLADVLQACSS